MISRRIQRCIQSRRHRITLETLQLATIKAKSEALRLRQEFELEKFRSKYRATQGASGGAPPGHRDLKEKGAEDTQQDGSESSEGHLSIRTEEAFDEPLKVCCSSPHTFAHCFA